MESVALGHIGYSVFQKVEIIGEFFIISRFSVMDGPMGCPRSHSPKGQTVIRKVKEILIGKFTKEIPPLNYSIVSKVIVRKI